jgi:hypothetical protein
MNYLIKFWYKSSVNGRELTSTRIEERTGTYDAVMEMVKSYVPPYDNGKVLAYQIYAAQTVVIKAE